MAMLSVERIKLFSTRSPYWCLLLVVVAALGFATIFGLVENGREAQLDTSQAGVQLGMMIFMVLAALAVTTEYRFATIRTSFLAEPNRIKVLLAKTVVLALLGAVVAAVISIASFFLTKALAADPPRPLELATGEDWRMVIGHSATFAIAAVIAVAVGTLVRQSAGAVAILLLWPLLLETLLGAIPSLTDASRYFPFASANAFVGARSRGVFLPDGPTPIQGLLIFVGTAAVLWVVAAGVLRRRDA